MQLSLQLIVKSPEALDVQPHVQSGSVQWIDAPDIGSLVFASKIFPFIMVCDWQTNPEKISSNVTAMRVIVGITKLLSFKKSEARLACISRHKNQVRHESLKNKNELIKWLQGDEK